MDIRYTLEIKDNSIVGMGTYDQISDDVVVRTVEIVVTGTYSYPDVVLQLTSEDGRSDTVTGTIDELGNVITGIMNMPRMKVPDVFTGRDRLLLSAGVDDLEVTFRRKTQ